MREDRFQYLVLSALSAILSELRDTRSDLDQQGEQIMHSIDEVISDIQDQETMAEGIGKLIDSLRAEIKNNTGALPTDVQAKIDAAFDRAEAVKAKLAAAMATTSDSTTPAPVANPPSDAPATSDSTAAASSAPTDATAAASTDPGNAAA